MRSETRTTALPTATSTLRVYQFRHDHKSLFDYRQRGDSKLLDLKQAYETIFTLLSDPMLNINMEWLITNNLVPYKKALAFMEKQFLKLK